MAHHEFCEVLKEGIDVMEQYPIQQRLNKLKHTKPSEELLRQLRQSVAVLNQCLNENAHRPDATRLLRQILRERAEQQAIRTRSPNSLSG